jgi:hypothetical protein
MPWANTTSKYEVETLDQITTSSPLPRQQQCLLKLYDKDTRAFKLNDVVTFIGILEFSPPGPAQDSQMTEYDNEEADLV